MDDIETTLREHAADDGASLSWDIHQNTFVTSVQAFTRDTFDTRETAFEAGVRLADLVLDLGYVLKNRAEIAAIADLWQEGAHHWRGHIDLVLEPAPPAAAL